MHPTSISTRLRIVDITILILIALAGCQSPAPPPPTPTSQAAPQTTPPVGVVPSPALGTVTSVAIVSTPGVSPTWQTEGPPPSPSPSPTPPVERKITGNVYTDAAEPGSELYGATVGCLFLVHPERGLPPDFASPCAPYSLTTGPDGTFAFTTGIDTHPGLETFILVASAPGYRLASCPVKCSYDGCGPCEIVMKPLASSPTEAIYFHIQGDSSGAGGSVWRYAPDQELLESLMPHDWYISAFDIWPGDGRMAYAVGASLFVVLPGQLPQLLYDASEWADYAPVVKSIAWSPDGTRLAYVMVSRAVNINTTPDTLSPFDGLWLLILEGERTRLASNKYCEWVYGPNECHTLSDPAWSPDGKALLVTAAHWEWDEFAVFDPVVAGSASVTRYDFKSTWSSGGNASWTRDSRAILLSTEGFYHFPALESIARGTTKTELLVGGEAGAGVARSIDLPHQQLPGGITFLMDGTLYMGQQTADGFTYAPIIEHPLCEGIEGDSWVRDIVWNSTNQTAVVICGYVQSIRLLSLDGTERDISPALEPLIGGKYGSYRVVWGP